MQIEPHIARAHAGVWTGAESKCELRLDGVRQPFGPCPAALQAMETEPSLPSSHLAKQLRLELAAAYRVPLDSILLQDGIDKCLAGIIGRATGRLVTFPPSATASCVAALPKTEEMIHVARGAGHHGRIDVACATDIPETAVAVIGSPSDPLGSILGAAEAVRLARACRVLVIDERFTEYSGFSALPLCLEFDNIVVLRTLETWAGLDNPPCAWAMTSLRAASFVGLSETAPDPKALAAGIATLQNLPTVRATIGLVREERSRLYRLLRKLSYLEPIPSWGPFLSARVNIVARDTLVSSLLTRGVYIHIPPHPALERIVRVGIGSRSAMERLKSVLLALGPELVGQ